MAGKARVTTKVLDRLYAARRAQKWKYTRSPAELLDMPML